MVNVKSRVDTSNSILRQNPNIYQNPDNAINNYGIDPENDVTPGLTPISDTGLYITPDDPASPLDCDRYPSSPYCGGNPFSYRPIGINLMPIITPCDIGISLTPVLAYIQLPPISIVYRQEECRIPAPLPPVPPGQPLNLPPTNCANASQSIVVAYTSSYEFIGQLEGNFEIGGVQSMGTVKLASNSYVATLQCPYEGDKKVKRLVITGNTYRYVDFPVRAYIKIVTNITTSTSGGYGYSNPQTATRTATQEHWITDLDNTFSIGTAPRPFGHDFGTIYINDYQQAMDDLTGFPSSSTLGNSTIFGIEKFNYSVEIACGNNKYPRQNSPPPGGGSGWIDDPNKRHCCMSCCTPSNSGNDELLKLLLKKVNKLSDIVGVNDYPMSLPPSLISKDEGWLGNLIPNANVDIPNQSRLFKWYIERFDEIMGQFEIPIEIKDSDPTTPGDQPVGIKLPNVAESIGEMFNLLLQIAINSETLVNMNTRLAIESGMDKQQNFKSYMLTHAIADYLGFKFTEKSHKMPLLFNIGKENLDELLQETEIDVPVAEFEDKTNFHESLHDLLQAAAIIRAVHYRKLDIKGDMKQQIIDLIKGYAATNKKDKAEDDFDKFIDDAETGFTNSTGITDSTHPYGKDFSQRPQIREIGKPTP